MSLELKTAAAIWLQSSHCMIVLTERSPFNHRGRPDVIGITDARHVVEIECKRTLSDFKADFKKRHIANTQWDIDNNHAHLSPRRFYYCVPLELVEKVKPLTPQWAGLLYVNGYAACVAKPAPVNKQAKKLSVRQCVHAAKLLSSQWIALQITNDVRLAAFGRDPTSHDLYHEYCNPNFVNWQI